MKNKIKLENTVNYSYDKITCFERPIVNQLNHLNEYYGDFFIIISKLYQFYFAKKEKNTREAIIELSEKSLNIGFHTINRYGFFKELRRIIDKNYPVILGINLKFLFYSKYYCVGSWPHWMLVTGYDTDKKLYYVLDDVQYIHKDNLYGDFKLTKNILKVINKKYVERYGKNWSGFYFDYIKERSVYEILLSILDVYFNFNFSNNKAYPQLYLLEDLSKFSNQNKNNQELIEELKKKILNSNKYRFVFVSEIEKHMIKLNFNNALVCLVRKLNNDLSMQWDSFITSNILKILTHSTIEHEIPNDIIKLELEIKEILYKFYEYLIYRKESSKNDALIKSELCDGLFIENDKNNIVKLSKDRIEFNFDDDNIYNWWFDDNAPKVIVDKILCQQDFEICTKINISPDFTCKNFQAGIFLRTKEKSLFCAIDVNNLFVIDEIGNLNKSGIFKFNNDISISVKKCGMSIVAEISDLKSKKLDLNWFFETNEKIELGFACKTWESKGKVKIRFYNFQVKRVKSYELRNKENTN